ncbi:MAG: hypothetical protein WDN04_23745 [Rhodospirillales bacterium]
MTATAILHGTAGDELASALAAAGIVGSDAPPASLLINLGRDPGRCHRRRGAVRRCGHRRRGQAGG